MASQSVETLVAIAVMAAVARGYLEALEQQGDGSLGGAEATRKK